MNNPWLKLWLESLADAINEAQSDLEARMSRDGMQELIERQMNFTRLSLAPITLSQKL